MTAMSIRSWPRLAASLAVALCLAGVGGARADGAVTQMVPHVAPLVDAVRARDSATAQKLLRESPRAAVKQLGVDGTTALHWAVYNDDADMVDRLVKAGADVNARNDYGATPLSQAAVVGNVRVIRRLLSAGADVEAANADGQTALMVLARSSNVEAASLLLKRGAKVDAREAWRGQTALMWAAAEAQPAMVKLLVDSGADVNARSKGQQLGAPGHGRAAPPGASCGWLHAAALCRAPRVCGMCAAAGEGRRQRG